MVDENLIFFFYSSLVFVTPRARARVTRMTDDMVCFVFVAGSAPGIFVNARRERSRR